MRTLRLPDFLFPRSPAGKAPQVVTNLAMVIHYTAILGFLGHLSFIGLFAWLGVRPMAAVNLVSCAFFGLCYWLNRRGRSHAALLLGAAEVVAHALLAILFIGWTSGFHYYMLGLLPLIFYSDRLRTPVKLGVSLGLGILYISAFCITLVIPPLFPITLAQERVVGTINIVTLFLVLIALAYVYRLSAALAEKALQQVNRRLEAQALTDPLTRLSNRRNVQAGLETAREAYRMYGIPFSVIMGDIDNFKAFNDRYGHEAGDAVLVHVAEIMLKTVRENDQVARWGGEEFLVLVAGGSAREASQVAERLRARIADSPLETADGPLHVTITLGVAEYSDAGDLNQTINRADDAMYEGKRKGKNCVNLDHENRPAINGAGGN